MRIAIVISAAVLAAVVGAVASSHTSQSRDSSHAGQGRLSYMGHTRYVSPHGSDNGPGTAERPWRTLRKAVSAARPGDTIIFRPGVYGRRGRRFKWTASGGADSPITFEGERGAPRPTILGYNKIEASNVHVLNLAFQGPTGPADPPTADNPGGEEVMVWIAGAHVELARCEVAGSRWHAGIYVAGGAGIRIIANYIHDNGDFPNPAQANLDHGIYWGYGNGGLIADNLIVNNLADGIVLYPDASGVIIDQNTIAANGKSGVQIASQSSYNTVVNNIVDGNADNSIRSFDLSGAGNVVQNNLVWNNGNGNIGTDAVGLTLSGSLQSDPQFVGAGDYRLRPGSPAIGRAQRVPAMLPYDLTGAPRGSHADIGAYQTK